MDFSLYYLLATLVLTTASPLQQKNPAVTEESLQASPSAAGHPLTPLGNAAIWQEAVAIDANKSVNGTPSYENQNFYILLATLQSDENSSNSHFDHSTSLISQGLEVLHAYPVQFSQAQAAQPVDAFIAISSPQQTVKSFGASGAWWPNDLNYFPPVQQQNLSQILFGESGLQLSGYRYNIGASGGHDNVTVSTNGRAVESFMTTDGTYDWTRDGPGTYYLQAAQSANVSSITFFVNAAPSALTAELAPCGTTLTSSAIVPFVSYIATVVSHWASQGIRIDYISPMNEPDNSFFKCTQEGMAIPTSTRAQVFQALRAALASSAAPNVKILGDETSQIASQALNEYDEWLPDTLSSIDSIAVHMYDWPDDATLLNYAQFVKTLSLPNPPPPIKMTEISSFQSAAGMHAPWGWTGPKIMGAQFDPGMDSALDMARMIWQWLTLVNAEEWDWWTAVSKEMPCSPSGGSGAAGCQFTPNAGWNDGLVYIDPAYQTTHNYNFYLPKRYWVFRHFSKFHRPGAVRYDIPNESLPYGTVAFASKAAEENGGMWSTVFVNRNFTAQEIRLRVPEKGFVVKEVVQTTEKVDWGTVPLPAVGTDGIVRLELPSRGVLTVRLGEEGTIAQRVVGRGWAGGGKEVGNR